MAPEGIKLPRDSTVASEKVHRNASAPTDATTETPKAQQSPTPSPLATVVLQSKAIIEGRKNELFQLLLQNDPKSAPPIKIYADTNISPGTALLLELDEKGHYQAIESPSKAQITKLITLELEFWQAHLYPKAASSSTPSLPAPEALIALAKQHPQLKPLIDWLTQRPNQLNGNTVKQWVQENSPLSLMRVFSSAPQNQSFNAPLNQLLTQQTSSTPQPSTQNNSALNAATQAFNASTKANLDGINSIKIDGTSNAPTNQTNGTSNIPTSQTNGTGNISTSQANGTSNISTSQTNGTSNVPTNQTAQPIETQTKTSTTGSPTQNVQTSAPLLIPIKAFLKFAFNLSLSQPVNKPVNANLPYSPTTPINQTASPADAQAKPPVTSSVTQTVQTPSTTPTTQINTHELLVPAALRSKLLAQNIGLLPTVKPIAAAHFIAEQSQRLNITIANNASAEKVALNLSSLNASTTPSIATGNSNPSATQTLINSAAVNVTNPVSTNASSTINTEQPKVNSANPVLPSNTSIQLNTASEFEPLASPIKTQTPELSTFKQITNELLQITSKQHAEPQADKPTASNLLEVKLGQWLTLLEQTQMKDAPELSQLLKTKAMAMLNNTGEQGEKIQHELNSQKQGSQPEKESSLNQLRSWMEATQAKVLHQAVQAASTQFQAPDLPVIQQMQLPLIWLGLTSWADLEWWQEKKKKQSSDEEDAESKRRWRMRIYLNINPLSEFCADIDWHPNDTHLVFWSEDTATLSHLNTLVPTLKEWTQGLSDESVIQTRHGMPKRASEQQLKRSNHHLVDVKT